MQPKFKPRRPRKPVPFLWALLVPALLVSEGAPTIRGPAWIPSCAVYYHPFERDVTTPVVNTKAISSPPGREAQVASRGLLGQAIDTTKAELTLTGSALSPHRPLTLSFWWALPRDHPIDGTFSLFQLSGRRGYISAFSRGKGTWCALKEPAGVLQVYHFEGIQNVNAIYDTALSTHLDLRAGVWHHTAVVFRQAATVELYTDGKRVADTTTKGREFTATDHLERLAIGGGVWIDELLILDRAVDAEQIADLYHGVRRLHEYQESMKPR